MLKYIFEKLQIPKGKELSWSGTMAAANTFICTGAQNKWMNSDTMSKQAEIQGQSIKTNVPFSFQDSRLSD